MIAEAKRKAKELEVVGTEGLSTTEEGTFFYDMKSYHDLMTFIIGWCVMEI